jgi:FkbM family methyltransferase
MTVPANSSQSWRAAFTGSYDDEVIDLLVPHVEPGSLVFDVGASFGFYTIPLGLAAQRVGARVVAVEPVGRNCDVLRRNVALNGLDGVVSVLPWALGAVPAQVTLHVETGGAGNAAIVTGLDPAEVARHDRAGNTGGTETVEVRRLDDLELPVDLRHRRCSLVKIDAEGFEMDILAGATSFLAAHRPALFAEFSPAWLQSRGLAASAPVGWAAAHGYTCHELVHTRARRTSDVLVSTLAPLAPTAPRRGTDLMLLPGPADQCSQRR